MKKNFIFGASLLLLAVLTSSCVQSSYLLQYKEATARSVEPKSLFYTTPVIGDLKITGDRITHTEEFKNVTLPLNNEKQLKKLVDNYQNITLARANAKVKADVLVGAMFTVDYEEENVVGGNILKNVLLKISVTGYPAVFTSFRNATEKDEWMMGFYLYDDELNRPKTTVVPAVPAQQVSGEDIQKRNRLVVPINK